MKNSAPSVTTSKGNLRTMMILIGGMAAGVFLFMLVAIFMNLTKGPLVPAMNKHQTTLSWAMAAL